MIIHHSILKVRLNKHALSFELKETFIQILFRVLPYYLDPFEVVFVHRFAQFYLFIIYNTITNFM